MSVYPFIETFSSAYAVALSLQIERALEASESSASQKRFIQIFDAETQAFLINSFGQIPNIDLQAFLDKIKLPTELVQKYLSQKNFADPLKFYDKEMTMREIRQLGVSEEDNLADILPSLEEVFQESNAQAEREDQIAEAAKEFAEDKWPFNRMTEEPSAGNISTVENAQVLEADLEQIVASAENPTREIQQLLEFSTEGFSDTLTQELNEILPSLETHFEEASRRAEVAEAAKIEAEQKAARIAAEEEAKKAAAASQGLLASLPSISSFFGSTPTATVAT